MSRFGLFTGENAIVDMPIDSALNLPDILAPFQSIPSQNIPAKKAVKRKYRKKAPLKHTPLDEEEPRPPLPPVDFKNYRTWFILPGNTILHNQLRMNTTSMKSAHDFVKRCKDTYMNYSPHVFSYLSKNSKINPYNSLLYSPCVIKTMQKLIYKNQRVRYFFKKCIHRWRISRMKQINTEDVVTGEVPVNPVYFYDWKNRSKYTFEARSLYKDICERLLNSQGLFCNPLYPRNMFTNLEFTPEQVHFIIADILKAGYSNIFTCAFVKAKYSLGNFTSLYITILKQNAIEKIFKQLTSLECADLVFDFFEMYRTRYNNHTQNPSMWSWAFENLNEGYPLVNEWRKLCKKYYIKCVSESDDVFNGTKIDIANEARQLLRMPSHHIMREWIRPYMNEARAEVEAEPRRRGRNDDTDSVTDDTTAAATAAATAATAAATAAAAAAPITPVTPIAPFVPSIIEPILQPYVTNVYFIDFFMEPE